VSSVEDRQFSNKFVRSGDGSVRQLDPILQV
jgi:hypothetical protein